MGEGIIIGGLLLALLSFFGGGKKDEPKDDRDPFCPPGPDGVPRIWDPNSQRCVPWVPGTPEPKDPGIVFPNFDPPVVDDVDAITRTYPTPASFYPVKFGDLFLGEKAGSIAYRALRTAGYLAAKNFGQLSDAEANAFGKNIASVGQKRSTYKNEIQCGSWNDRLYGTYGFDESKAVPSTNGRAIRLLPRHANNAERLRAGQAPIRSLQLRTPFDIGKGNAGTAAGAPSGSFEFLWLPGLDLEHLWLTSGQLRFVERDPPPWVMDLGIEDRSNSGDPPNGWGC